MKHKMIIFFIILLGVGFLILPSKETNLPTEKLQLQIGVAPHTNSDTLYYEPLITNDTEQNETLIQDMLSLFESAKELDDVISIGGNGDYELHVYNTDTKESLVSGNILLTNDGGIFTSRTSDTSLELTDEDITYIKQLIKEN